jgi:arylesterase/paraoxonase
MAPDKVLAASTMRVIVRDPPIEIPGPEDIVIDHAASIALVASQQRVSASRKLLEPDEMPGGAVYGLDLNAVPLAKRPLVDQASLGFAFHPRGCSFFAGETGDRRLMVISDRSNSDHVVEIFDVVGEKFEALTLKHIHTVVDADHLISPNDLVALDGERFYAGNDHGARSKLLRGVEDLTGLPLSTVSFWDGSRGHTVASGISFANGMALDRARGRLYVAATRSKKISVYPWDAQAPAKWLVESESISLPGCPDNLEWDEEGNLWIGADPNFMKLGLFALGVLKRAPSQVLCVSFRPQHEPRVEEVWRDETGETISASSVAAVHGKGRVRRLLIGQPFGSFLRDCELVTLGAP